MKEKRPKREDFRGWTWRLFGWEVEFVTVRHLLRVIALSNDRGTHLVKRFER
jgi:hypothetical protein